jgi:hypothetical protein
MNSSKMKTEYRVGGGLIVTSKQQDKNEKPLQRLNIANNLKQNTANNLRQGTKCNAYQT